MIVAVRRRSVHREIARRTVPEFTGSLRWIMNCVGWVVTTLPQAGSAVVTAETDQVSVGEGILLGWLLIGYSSVSP